MFFWIIFVVSFFGAITFYKRQRPQWKSSLLFSQEQVVFEQSKTTINTLSSDGVRHGMAWGFVRVTNKRMFFLYPDKKAISKILDFSGEKQKSIDDILQRNILYLDRVSMKVSLDPQGRGSFHAKAVDYFGKIVEYQFAVRDVQKLKKALEI